VLRVLRTQSDLDSLGSGAVLVPTMGALHEGHAALVRRGAALAGCSRAACVVSIFVNPTQFNQRFDFDRYPRTLDADLDLCGRAGATAVFAPDPKTVYPEGTLVPVPPLPEVAVRPGLEDAFRPGHFAGVCQVVMRLFRLVRPAAAVFGEKDWQQLQVVSAMTREAELALSIDAYPTQRDPDGLAMSSRNRFLSVQERAAALAIPRALAAGARQPDPAAAESAMREVLGSAPLRVEYAVCRDAESLGPVFPPRPGRVLIAAWSGATRLIDNAGWPGA
jgi:pantoate--beta-alanine ligase